MPCLLLFIHKCKKIFIYSRDIITKQLKQTTNLSYLLKYLILSTLSIEFMAVYTITDTFVADKKLGIIALDVSLKRLAEHPFKTI
ncbi:hypothetical protein C823_006202 [Eubacterium plexicaudatum ASF492]|nr:hypothetical protein C823_006202 [Eubacterium plexicaudatum ASF492]